MLPFGGTFSRSTVPLSCSSNPSGGFRVRHHNITVRERIAWRPGETAVQPSLLKHNLALGISVHAGPRGLKTLRRRDVACFGPDASEEVPMSVVSAKDEATDQTHQSMEAVRVQGFLALAI